MLIPSSGLALYLKRRTGLGVADTIQRCEAPKAAYPLRPAETCLSANGQLLPSLGKRSLATVFHAISFSDKAAPGPLDHVNRQFHAPAPNRLWVPDFTYVSTWGGFVYVAFVTDVYAHYIVSWRVSRTAPTSFVLDALEQALHDRRPTQGGGLVHHSDRGSQYVSIKYSESLAEAGIEPSVGSVGDSYDNAVAETINGLYRARSSIGEDHGGRLKQSSSPHWSGWTGSTTVDCLNPSATFHLPKPNNDTTPCWTTSPWLRNLNQMASGDPGAVHSQTEHMPSVSVAPF
jgi:putative transposase